MPVYQPPSASSGSVATDVIWDAAGDLAVGTGADTASKVSLGASATVLSSTGSTAAWTVPVGTIVDRATFTTDVTISATTEGTANTIVSGAGFTADGTSSYWIEMFSPGVIPGSSVGATINFSIYLDGAAISVGHSIIGQVANPTAATICYPSLQKYFAATPAAGTRTFSWRAWRGVANGSVRGDTATLGLVGYISISKAS